MSWCKACFKTWQKLRYESKIAKNPNFFTLKNKEGRARTRAEALRVLSGVPPSCQDCGILDERVLTIDHVLRDGEEDRKNLYSMYKRIAENPDNKRYAVVCRNCNWIRYKEWGDDELK